MAAGLAVCGGRRDGWQRSDGIAYFLFSGRTISARRPRGRTTRPGTLRSRWPRGAAKNRQGFEGDIERYRLESPGSPREPRPLIGTRIMQVWDGAASGEVEPAGLGHLALEHEAASARESPGRWG